MQSRDLEFHGDPGVDVDTVGSIQEFLNGDGHHVAIITFNEEGLM